MNNRVPPLTRLAIVISHPIQYYAPWFVFLTSNLHAHIRVFYLSDVGGDIKDGHWVWTGSLLGYRSPFGI